MVNVTTVIIFAFIFLLLLGFFPLIYYIVSMLYKKMTKRQRSADLPPGDYSLSKLREVKEQKIRI